MNALVVFSLLVAAAAAEMCNNACQYNYDPVCGTDGKTYGNGCELESRACMTRMPTKVAYSGECRKTIMNSACNQLCTFNLEPVCGTDGETYDNECSMNSVACMAKKTVTKAYAGQCLRSLSKAEQIEKVTGCAIACTANYEPVCGSDGNTYGNNCELQSLSCMRKNNVKVAHSGECGKIAKSECNQICTFNYEPVCGTDAHTYSNMCELQSLSCMRKSGVKVARVGEC